ncbi:MAG: tripartite tricarboxylate transporter TctB family protein [Hyphomicrobiales bacterium]|nr:tripartite tricarboxylate transporter TctB family protein [Hyphomicrobiales bacterium]
MVRIRSPQDFAAGLFFLGVGAFALYGMADLRVGTALRMGPAYIPKLISWGLVLAGGAIAARALVIPGAGLERWAWKPLLLVCGGTAAFALMISQLGLFLASVALTLVVSFGTTGAKWRQVIPFSLVLAGAAAGLFGGLLGLPMRLWPW